MGKNDNDFQLIKSLIQSLDRTTQESIKRIEDTNTGAISNFAVGVHSKLDILLEKYDDLKNFGEKLDTRTQVLEDSKIELSLKAQNFKQKLADIEKETSFIRVISRFPKMVVIGFLLIIYLITSTEVRKMFFDLIKLMK